MLGQVPSRDVFPTTIRIASYFALPCGPFPASLATVAGICTAVERKGLPAPSASPCTLPDPTGYGSGPLCAIAYVTRPKVAHECNQAVLDPKALRVWS